MIRFIKHNFDNMEGVAIYPIVSLVLFFAIFTAMVVLVMRLKKNYIEENSQLPLEDDENNLNN